MNFEQFWEVEQLWDFWRIFEKRKNMEPKFEFCDRIFIYYVFSFNKMSKSKNVLNWSYQTQKSKTSQEGGEGEE